LEDGGQRADQQQVEGDDAQGDGGVVEALVEDGDQVVPREVLRADVDAQDEERRVRRDQQQGEQADALVEPGQAHAQGRVVRRERREEDAHAQLRPDEDESHEAHDAHAHVGRLPGRRLAVQVDGQGTELLQPGGHQDREGQDGQPGDSSKDLRHVGLIVALATGRSQPVSTG